MVDRPVHHAQLRLLRRLKRNVRDFRRAMNLTVKAAAARAHVPWRYWQRIEAGEVNATIARITQIAGALGVEPQHLMLSPSSRERERLLKETVRHAGQARKGRGR
jgi:transcriptional regulator with XRE-family HTH domain